MKYSRPNGISALIFIGLISVQFCLGGTTIISHSGRVTEKSGIGGPLTTTYDHGTKQRNIKWGILLSNILVCFVLAQAISQAAIRRTLFTKPVRVYLLVAISISLTGLVVAMGVSRRYWGYYFVRPPLPRELSDLSVVNLVVPLQTVKDEQGVRHFTVRADSSSQRSFSN